MRSHDTELEPFIEQRSHTISQPRPNKSSLLVGAFLLMNCLLSLLLLLRVRAVSQPRSLDKICNFHTEQYRENEPDPRELHLLITRT